MKNTIIRLALVSLSLTLIFHARASTNGDNLLGVGAGYYYETFRIIGFPAIVEHHLSVGLGYRLSDRSSLDAGYTHAFRNTITEQGTNLLGSPVTLSSRLSEDSFELGFKYRF
jgi:long-chain fatty acid transport protein